MFRFRTKPSVVRRRPLGVLLALALPAAMAGVLLGPAGSAHAAGSTVYVTDDDTDSVVAVDAASGTVTATIPVAGGPEYTAVTPDGRQVLVSSIRAISVISTSSDTVTATIPIDSYVPDDDDARQVTVDPAGAFAYVVTTDGYVLKIDTATDTVTGTVRVAQSTAANATRAVAISPDGTTLYVSGDSSSVTVVDTATLTVAPSSTPATSAAGPSPLPLTAATSTLPMNSTSSRRQLSLTSSAPRPASSPRPSRSPRTTTPLRGWRSPQTVHPSTSPPVSLTPFL